MWQEMLLRTGLQVFDQIPHHEHAQVHRRSPAFAEPVVAVGIGHVVEPLSEFDEAIDQPFGDLDVRVGLACPVNDQEVSLQALGKVDGGRPTVSIRIRLAGLHVDLLEPRIVEMGLRLGRDGDPHVIDIGLAEHRVERVRATAAPAPDAHPGQVDVRTGAGELFQARRLLLGGERTEAAEHRPPPRGSFGRRRAPVVDGHHQITEVGDQAMVVGMDFSPGVQHGLCVRLSIHVDENGVFPRRIEAVRFDHPRVHDHAAADIELQELRRL